MFFNAEKIVNFDRGIKVKQFRKFNKFFPANLFNLLEKIPSRVNQSINH